MSHKTDPGVQVLPAGESGDIDSKLGISVGSMLGIPRIFVGSNIGFSIGSLPGIFVGSMLGISIGSMSGNSPIPMPTSGSFGSQQKLGAGIKERTNNPTVANAFLIISNFQLI